VGPELGATAAGSKLLRDSVVGLVVVVFVVVLLVLVVAQDTLLRAVFGLAFWVAVGSDCCCC
jgi:hypothetical protein